MSLRLSASAPLLSPGDIITIPSDQYGRPVYRFDPVTRKPTAELQQFRVLDVAAGSVTLVHAIEPRPELRRAFYRSAQ